MAVNDATLEKWKEEKIIFLNCVIEKCIENTLNPSIINKRKSRHLLKVLIGKLKFKCFGCIIQWQESLEKTPIFGKIEGPQKRQGRLDTVTDDTNVNQPVWSDAHWVTKSWKNKATIELCIILHCNSILRIYNIPINLNPSSSIKLFGRTT